MMERGPSTASCLVYVTPDAQRTMATYIGACRAVSGSDIDEQVVSIPASYISRAICGNAEHAKAAIRKAITWHRKPGRKIAFTLSDTFCVDRHRAEFMELIARDIDILFANEAEIKSLYQTRAMSSRR